MRAYLSALYAIGLLAPTLSVAQEADALIGYVSTLQEK